MASEKVLILTLAGFVLSILLWFYLLRRHRLHPLKVKELLLLVFAAGFVCRLAFSFGTPVFYAPDEEAHFNYIQYLDEKGELPVQTNKDQSLAANYEYYQPPLYYLISLPVYRLAHALTEKTGEIVIALRLFNLLIWLGVVFFSLRLMARLKITDEFLKVCGFGMICLLPTYTFLSTMINNDHAVMILGTVLLWLIANPKFTMTSAVLTGMTLGLALTAKMSAIVYLPAVFLLLFFQSLRQPACRKSHLLYAAVIALVSGAIWLPCVLRNGSLYGSITAENVGNVRVVWPSFLGGLVKMGHYLVVSFWAVSGVYNEIRFYFPYAGVLLSLAGGGGLFYSLFSSKRRESLFSERALVPFGAAMTAAILINVLLVLRFGILYGQAQGRFLFPFLLPIALVMGIGLRVYPLKSRSVHFTGIMIAYAVTFTLYSLAEFTRL